MRFKIQSSNANAGARSARPLQDVPSSDDPAPIPGVDFIGRGYDIVGFDPLEPGNPKAISQTPIFELDVSVPTTDRQFLIPRGAVYTPDPRLEFNAESKELESGFDLGQTFSAGIQASGGYGGVSFSASTSYEEINEMTAATTSIVSYASFQVTVWVLTWQAATLAQGFKDAVKALPIVYDESVYFGFIRSFGTHYPQGITYGGAGYQSYRFTRASRSQLLSEKVDVSVGAEVGLALAAKVGGESGEARKDFESLSAVSDASTLNYVGGVDPSSFEAFAASINRSPVPVRMQLREIVELLTETNFPGVGISTIKNNLAQANGAHALRNGGGYVKYAADRTSTDNVYNLVGARAPEYFLAPLGGSFAPVLADGKYITTVGATWHLLSSGVAGGTIARTGDRLTISLNPSEGAFLDLGAAKFSNEPTDSAVGARDSTTMWRVVDPLDPTNTGAPVLLGKMYVLQNVAIGQGLGFYLQTSTNGGFYVPVSGAPSDQRTWCRFL